MVVGAKGGRYCFEAVSELSFGNLEVELRPSHVPLTHNELLLRNVASEQDTVTHQRLKF